MAKDDLNRALRKQRNANDKVRRLENKGIRIRNTSENPGRTPSEIRGMTPMQLAEHEARLNAFTNRSTQFVAGIENRAIPKAVADQFKGLRDVYNEAVKRIEDKVRPVTRPGSDTTVGTVLDNRKQLSEQGMRQAQRVFNPDNRNEKNFASAAQMQRAMEELRQKSSDRYLKSTIDKRLNSIRAALAYSGNVDMVDMIDELTWSQRLFLLDYSLFGSIAALNIDSGKYDSTGSVREGWAGDDTPTQDDEMLHNDLLTELQWVRKNGGKTSFRGIGRRARGGGKTS